MTYIHIHMTLSLLTEEEWEDDTEMANIDRKKGEVSLSLSEAGGGDRSTPVRVPPLHPELVEGLELAQEQFDWGLYDQARELLEGILGASETAGLIKGDEILVTAHLLFGEIDRAQGRYKRAQEAYDRAEVMLQQAEKEGTCRVIYLVHMGNCFSVLCWTALL